MVSSILDALLAAGARPDSGAGAVDKKNFAERLSRQLARLFADSLRPAFPGILPSADGSGQESMARTSKGYKKLDVNYSTPELGLGLGVSIKTITAPDPRTKRYTKNYTRIDAELRAEAVDYHKRQPFAVLIAVIFLPEEACFDGSTTPGTVPSSFGAAVRTFRDRANRRDYRDDLDLFERVLVGIYRPDGQVAFMDVMQAPPRQGRPRDSKLLSFSAALDEVRRTYDARNKPTFEWDDGQPRADQTAR